MAFCTSDSLSNRLLHHLVKVSRLLDFLTGNPSSSSENGVDSDQLLVPASKEDTVNSRYLDFGYLE